jgi:serine/threonine protein kinase
MMERVKNLGVGGFGYVDLYLNSSDSTYYAVKFMQGFWDNANYQRFVQEINILKQLNHKNIIKVLNFNIKGNNPHYLMPFYVRGSLRTILNEYKDKNLIFTPQAAMSIILMLADAMQYAHSKGCIHRDLKPENILFDGQIPIIADWGIGKFIHKGSVVLNQHGGLGTPVYCSPEQWAGYTTDHRTDIYALGVIFREVLTGHPKGIVNDASLNSIILKMIDDNPNARYSSMQAVINDIKALGNTPQNPEDTFWEDVAKAGLVIGGAALGGIILVEIINKLFKK